uniref:Zinc finger CCCH domain-containing protein 2 n=1 Tax=Rhizophora mucronata TaxID=61149 RepID=A0A2P2P2J5_RHIMU
MSTICAEQHKLRTFHQLLPTKEHSKDLEIPPRKLLTKKTHQENSLDVSPCGEFPNNLHGYLSCNDCTNYKESADDDDLDPYSFDHFRMYEFKVRRCTRNRSHDWTDCPFAHPGEKARRRDPRRYHYSGAICPEFRRGGCSRGDNCEFAHGVFECWLHPSRYRTEACKDGKKCNRKVCFFAHSPRQLRIPPEITCGSRKMDRGLASSCSSSPPLNHGHCYCLVCHSVASSPTSTLLGMSHLSPPLSPSMSPPLSQEKHRSLCGLLPISRNSDCLSKLRSGRALSYKDELTELMSSLEAMNFNGTAAPRVSVSANNRNVKIPWIDASLIAGEDLQQFILSPSAPSPAGSKNIFNGDFSRKGLIDEKTNIPDPDLGWVNDLLM